MTITRNLAIILTFISFTLGLTACAEKRVETSQAPWPFFQGNVIHKGYVETDYIPSLSRRWLVDLDLDEKPVPKKGQEFASPVAGNDMVFFGSVRGKGVKALDYKSGKLLWSFKVDKGVESSPALYEGKLYFGANDGFLYALDAKSGELLWKIDTGAEILSSPVAAEGMLFFVNSADHIFAADALTGKSLWRYKRGGGGLYSIRMASSPSYREGILYLGFTDGTVAALVAFDGSVVWENNLTSRHGLRFTDIDSSPVLDGDTLYVASYDDWLFAIDAAEGDILWKVRTGGFSTPVVDEKRLYFGDKKGRFLAFDKNSGERVWEYTLKEGVPTSAIIIGDYIIFGSSHKRLYLLSKEDGKVIDTQKTTKGFLASPAYYRGVIYAISNAGYAYALGR